MPNENITSQNTVDGVQATTNSPQPQAGTSGSQAERRSSSNDLSELSPEELRALVKELRNKDAKNRKKFDEIELAKQEELRQQMEEQGKFKELAEQRATEIEQLKQYQERYNKLAEQFGSHVDDLIKNWPAQVKALVSGEDAPIEQRLEEVRKFQPLADQLSQQAKASQPGNSPNPRPADGQASQRQRIDAMKERNRSRYSGF